MHTTTSRRGIESGLIAITHGLRDAVTTTLAVSVYGLPEINPVVGALLDYSYVATFLVVTVAGIGVGSIWYIVRPSFVHRYSQQLAQIVGICFVASGFLLVVSNTLAIATRTLG